MVVNSSLAVLITPVVALIGIFELLLENVPPVVFITGVILELARKGEVYKIYGVSEVLLKGS